MKTIKEFIIMEKLSPQPALVQDIIEFSLPFHSFIHKTCISYSGNLEIVPKVFGLGAEKCCHSALLNAHCRTIIVWKSAQYGNVAPHRQK